MSLLRTIFALARFSTFPTVWSNCLAGWWLGGAGHTEYLPFIFAGATFLYAGGGLLKDAFDADFDREHRPSRPIPAGVISERTAFRSGLVLLTFGALLLLWPGHLTGALGLFLVFLIVLHNTTLRLFPVAPLLRGLCRLLLYLLGASVAVRGITGLTIWCGLALAAYTAGVGYLALHRAPPTTPGAWALVPLATPVALGVILNVGEYRESSLLLSGVLFLWGLRSIRNLFWTSPPDRVQGLGGLTAGIVFVDWLATCPLNVPAPFGNGPRQLSLIFLGLFALTFLCQKLFPEPQSPATPLPQAPSSPPAT